MPHLILKYLKPFRLFKKSYLTLTFILICAVSLFSQEEFYDSGSVREIKIYFEDDNWKSVLDSLFLSGDTYSRIKADVEIDGNLYKKCGIRYKGFSSWNADELKNPFSINLDYTYVNQNHQGYKKLKLSNVIYDPSFVREVLAYGIARKYMPASEANFANVYINDTLIGLYTNVEAVDECFVDKHFGYKNNPFFKGNPETLSYPFGQNANLAYTHGEDSSGYMPYYSLESKYGWEELFNFINVLNNDTANIATVLNIDRALWMHAFNYAILNLDSYIAYAQNFYVYQDDNQQFNTIPWDLNMSFGSFRHSDGATNFQGVTITKLPLLNPLQHMIFSISPRPLMKNLFLNPTYRKMYLAHLRTIISENINNGSYLETGEQLHDLIEDYVEADTNKFYSNEDFEENLYSTTGLSTEQFPGIQDLMESRAAYIETYPGISGYPVFGEPELSATTAIRNHSLGITVKVPGAQKVWLYHRDNCDGVFTASVMYDDGINGDMYAGDSLFYAEIIPVGKNFEYYFWAENDSSGSFLPERAAYEFFNVPVRTEPGDVVINEIIYNNYDFGDVAGLNDIEAIEIFNPGEEKLFLKNIKIRCQGTGFDIVDTTIAGRGFLIVYLSQTDLYATDLNAVNGDIIELISDSDIQVDCFLLEICADNRSVGRFPDGYNQSSVLIPTPGKFNSQPENINSTLLVYPIPSDDEVYLELASVESITTVLIYNPAGELMYSSGPIGNDYFSIAIDIKTWKPSVYYVNVISESDVRSSVFVKL